MINGEAFRKCYYTDAIERKTIEKINESIENKGRIGAVNELTEKMQYEMSQQQQITKEEQEGDKVR